jgi:translation initiation factor IF-3
LRKGNNFKRNTVSFRINHEIHASTVRLLDERGTQIGVLSLPEAAKLAEEKVLDLVEIAPQAKPPVVKLIDYNKFLYQLKKKKQEEKKHAHVSETKQVQFGPFIDEHDLGIKLERAREFITDGDKVRFVVKFKGRQMAKQNLGRELLVKATLKMDDIAKVEQPIKMEGRQMIMVMSKGVKKDETEVKEVSSSQVVASSDTSPIEQTKR